MTDIDPALAPSITGTVAGQTTTSEAPVDPFASVTISDPNMGATDALTITLSNNGTTGTLSGQGLSGGTNGVYKFAAASAATITSELQQLVFTPNAGAPGTSTATTFTLSDLSSADVTPTVDSTTTMINTDPSSSPVLDARNFSATPHAGTVADPWPESAIANAIAALPSTGGTVMIANGVWSINSPLESTRTILSLLARAPLRNLGSQTPGKCGSAAIPRSSIPMALRRLGSLTTQCRDSQSMPTICRFRIVGRCGGAIV